MKDLFDRCEFGDLKLNSRIVRTGLWESQRESSGNLTPEIYNRYENIAASGVGLIISELYSLYPRDVFSKYSNTIHYTQFVREARDLTDLVHIYDVPIFAQLGFVQFNKKAEQNMRVEAISIEDIRKIQTDMIIAAQKFAGFDGIQIGLGNYYFLSRFINPNFNTREDKYGGNTFNRLRIVLEMIKVIKENTNLHINCRLNAFDGTTNGMTLNETIDISKLLEKYGVDSLQITRPRSPQFFTHENKDILDQITAPYTIPEKEKLAGLENYDDTEIRQLIHDTGHTHPNKDILFESNSAKNEKKNILFYGTKWKRFFR